MVRTRWPGTTNLAVVRTGDGMAVVASGLAGEPVEQKSRLARKLYTASQSLGRSPPNLLASALIWVSGSLGNGTT